MSTKIWTAYRLRKPSLLWPLVRDIRKQGVKNVQTVLRGMYREFAKGVDTAKPMYQRQHDFYAKLRTDPAEIEQQARLAVAHSIIQRAYRMNRTTTLRNAFDFDVSVSFRSNGRAVFLIPYCDWSMISVLNFLKKDPRLEDYHYQNQTDRPKHINPRHWGARKRTWNAMLDASRWDDVLLLEVCKWDLWFKVDPWWDMT